MTGESSYKVLRVNRCCRIWVPEIVQSAGQGLRQALEGESGANLVHLRKRFPDVKIIISGDPSGTASASQRLHVAAACKDKVTRDRVASDLVDLVETACDLVADSLGLDEEQVQNAFEAIQVEKYSVHVERCDELENSRTEETTASPGGLPSSGILEMVVRRLELAMGGNDCEILASAIEAASNAGVCKDLIEKATSRKMELERLQDLEFIDHFLQERQAVTRALHLQRSSEDPNILQETLRRAVSVGISDETLEPARKRLALLKKRQCGLLSANKSKQISDSKLIQSHEPCQEAPSDVPKSSTLSVHRESSSLDVAEIVESTAVEAKRQKLDVARRLTPEHDAWADENV